MTISQEHADVANSAPKRQLPSVEHDRGPSFLMQVGHIFWRILTNLPMHRKVIQVLRLRPFAAIVGCNPKFAFKYLATKYLVRGLSVTARASCFMHHYTRLYDSISDRALHQILHWDIEFGAIFEAGSRFSVTIGTSRPFDNEGELSLLLKMDGEIFFTLSFTIVPGWVVNSGATDVLLISRLQGTPGYSPEQIRLAIRAMDGVRPRALLLSALEGIAIAMGIPEIASVSTRNHIDYCKELDAVFKNSYDDFFTELGLVNSDAGFFTSTVPIDEKPLSLVKQGHKIRTRKKRAFRKRVRLACSEGFLKMTGKVQSSSQFNGEDVTPGLDALEVEFIASQVSVIETAELSHPGPCYLVDEKTCGR
jgi:uncharacterized protein VirK/YbjX